MYSVVYLGVHTIAWFKISHAGVLIEHTIVFLKLVIQVQRLRFNDHGACFQLFI